MTGGRPRGRLTSGAIVGERATNQSHLMLTYAYQLGCQQCTSLARSMSEWISIKNPSLLHTLPRHTTLMSSTSAPSAHAYAIATSERFPPGLVSAALPSASPPAPLPAASNSQTIARGDTTFKRCHARHACIISTPPPAR